MQNTLLDPLLSKQKASCFIYFEVLWNTKINEKLIPQALSDLGLDAGNIVNAILLSNLAPKEDSSAAATIIFTTQVVIVVIPSAFLYVLAPIIQYYMKAHKSAVITASILFALFLSLPGAIASFFMGEIFLRIGVSSSVCEIVEEYFSVFSFSLSLWMVATALNKTAMPLGYERLMYIESLINFMGITGFSSFFVRVYPLPYFSPVQTIALSYAVCAIARILLYGVAYTCFDEFEHWQNINFTRYKEAIMHMITLGWKLGLQLTSELVALYILTILVGLIPNNKMNLSILNVMAQYFSFSIIITLAMAVTAMNLVGEFCNKKQYSEVRSHVNTLLIMSTVYNILLFLIVMSIPDEITGLFMNPAENKNTGLSGDFRCMFAITFLGLTFNAYKDIINMAQRSLNMYSLPMKVSVGGVWGIGIPLAIVFAIGTNLGIGGLWLGYNIGNILTGLFLLGHWHLVSQPEVVQEIFTEGSNKARELDQMTYCLSCYKEVFFQANDREKKSVYLNPVV